MGQKAKQRASTRVHPASDGPIRHPYIIHSPVSLSSPSSFSSFLPCESWWPIAGFPRFRSAYSPLSRADWRGRAQVECARGGSWRLTCRCALRWKGWTRCVPGAPAATRDHLRRARGRRPYGLRCPFLLDVAADGASRTRGGDDSRSGFSTESRWPPGCLRLTERIQLLLSWLG
jgi:hypothetical protein